MTGTRPRLQRVPVPRGLPRVTAGGYRVWLLNWRPWLYATPAGSRVVVWRRCRRAITQARAPPMGAVCARVLQAPARSHLLANEQATWPGHHHRPTWSMRPLERGNGEYTTVLLVGSGP